jgi:hypothetical protein
MFRRSPRFLNKGVKDVNSFSVANDVDRPILVAAPGGSELPDASTHRSHEPAVYWSNAELQPSNVLAELCLNSFWELSEDIQMTSLLCTRDYIEKGIIVKEKYTVFDIFR